MATSTFLSNATITVNSVSLTDQASSVTVTEKYTQLRATALGDTSEKYTAGLGDHEIAVTLYMSYAATETYATLQALVGTTTTVVVTPTTATVSATNPSFTLTGAYLEVLPLLQSTTGELSQIDVVWRGGTLTKGTTPP